MATWQCIKKFRGRATPDYLKKLSLGDIRQCQWRADVTALEWSLAYWPAWEMHCNNLRLVLGLGLVRVNSRVRVRVKVSVLVRVSIRTSWVVNLALFRCYRPVIYTRPRGCWCRQQLCCFFWFLNVELRRGTSRRYVCMYVCMYVEVFMFAQHLTA